MKVEQGRRGSAAPAGRAGEPIRTAVRQPGAEAAAQPGAEAATEPAPRPARKAATRRTRVADVAAQAGVSKTAVSFAFNSPERLNAETAAKILEVADELGYRPPPAAHATVGKNTMTIGLLTPQVLSGMFGDPFYTELSAGVAAQTDGAGYGLLFVSRRNGSLNRDAATEESSCRYEAATEPGLSPRAPACEPCRWRPFRWGKAAFCTDCPA